MPTFNEAERYLIKNWTDARLVEDAIDQIRTRYKAVLDKVLEQVSKKHRELDCSKKYIVADYGGLAIGKDAWPKGSYAWPSGFSIENVQMELLTAPEQEAPYKCVWISDPNMERNDTKAMFFNAAKRFRLQERNLEWYSEKYGFGVWCNLEESRTELLDYLFKDDGTEFVDCIVEHFEWLTQFTPVVDEILAKGKRGRK